MQIKLSQKRIFKVKQMKHKLKYVILELSNLKIEDCYKRIQLTKANK